MSREKKIVEIKTNNKLYVILFVSLILVLVSAQRIYLYLFPEEPVITSVFGEIEVFVNGIWVPARAGMNLANAKIRTKKGAELKIGDKIIKAQEDTEISLSDEGSFRVQKGSVAIISQEGQEQKIEKAEVKEEERLVKGEKERGKIVKVIVKNAKEKNGKKIINSKRAVIEIITENINNLKINGASYSSDSGVFEVNLMLKEGENIIDIVGLDEEKRVVDRKEEIVFVDTSPPKVKILRKVKFD